MGGKLDIFNKKYQDPGKDFYHFPAGPSHPSPCMSFYWLHKPIRQGTKILNTEHDKIDTEDEEREK